MLPPSNLFRSDKFQVRPRRSNGLAASRTSVSAIEFLSAFCAADYRSTQGCTFAELRSDPFCAARLSMSSGRSDARLGVITRLAMVGPAATGPLSTARLLGNV